jgi:hypothetical protein
MKRNWFSLKWAQFKEWFAKQKVKVYNKVKCYVFNKELNNWTNKVIYDSYGAVKLIKSKPNNWVFSPVEAVQYVLHLHFQDTCFKMGIFGIDVDTQDETIDVTIRLKRPGYLIGKGGQDIDTITKELKRVFNMPTTIHIVEVKKDNNEPYIYY